MDNEKILKDFEKEPLGEVPKKDRKALLGLSLAGYAILKIGILPSRISALGIEFTPVNQKAILTVLALSIGYFLIAFLIHSLSDFLGYRKAEYEWSVKKGLELEKETNVERQLRLEIERRIIEDNKLSQAPTTLIKWIKAVFEFFLPFYIGLHVLILLTTA